MTKSNIKDYTGGRSAQGIIHFIDTESALEGKGNDAVVELTERNFDRVVDGSKHVLVEFYAPWCGHCQSLAPQYEKLARSYRKSKDKVVIAKVDADQWRDLGMRWGVSGYPTIKLFQSQDVTKPLTYTGYRNAAALSEYLEKEVGLKPGKQSESASTAVNSADSTQEEEEEEEEEEDGSIKGTAQQKFDYESIITGHFREVDSNADGFVMRDEARLMFEMLDEPEQKIGQLVEKMFDDMDLNSDKKISLYEFKTGGV
jgi:protein disulfide-isomerase A6